MASTMDTDRSRSKAAASQGIRGVSGGSVDDTQKRLSVIELAVAEIRVVLLGLVTKTELEQFRGAMRADFEQFRGAMKADFQQLRGEMKAEVEQLRGDIREIKATLPHLATKAEVQGVRTEIQVVRTEIEVVRTEIEAVKAEVVELNGKIDRVEGSLKAELSRVEGSLRSEMHSMQAANIKWTIGTAIAMTAVVFSITRFLP